MLQILGLREHPSNGNSRKREVFFTKNYRAENLEQILQDTAKVLAPVPEAERYNLYFTVAQCFEEPGRKLKEQNYIPFDIDGLTLAEDAEPVARTAVAALGLDWNQTGVVFSGNGVQFFIKIATPILSEDYFDDTRVHYKALCDRINVALIQKGLPGRSDTSVYSKGRLMRMPGTFNVKPDKPRREATVLQSQLTAIDFDIVARSGVVDIMSTEAISPVALARMPKPDAKAVCEGCKFLTWCKAEQDKVIEPQWYAMLSIVGRLDTEGHMAHEYSEKHPRYSFYETQLKYEQAISNSGPRTCKNIATLWDGCTTCENYDQVTSPIMIKGPDYIKSKDTGFRDTKINKQGVPTTGAPAYSDLCKQFMNEGTFITIQDNAFIYRFNGTHWVHWSDLQIHAWASEIVVPSPSSAECREFLFRLKTINVKPMEWLDNRRAGLMNFKNGVLDLHTMELHPHSPDYGFVNVLPYDYDPRAESPLYDKFLNDMTECPETSELINAFGGYCVSGDDPNLFAKALLLVGHGANGKSVWIETLASVVGKDNYSSCFMQELGNEQNRHMLIGKLLNYSEETNLRALSDSSHFKNLVSGGSMQVKKIYTPPFVIKNWAKIILSANEMPYSTDKSDGLYRRLIIVELKRQFFGKDADIFLSEKLKKELSGICNRMIVAYKKTKDQSYFKLPASVERSIAVYKEESNTVDRFFNECVEIVEDSEAPQPELYSMYKQYCDEYNEYALSSIGFFRALEKNVLKDLRDRIYRKRTNGAIKKMVKGIKLQKEF